MWTRRVRPAGDRGGWALPIYADVPDIPYGTDIGFVVLVEIIVGGYLDPHTLLAADGATCGCHRLVDHPQAIRTPELPICEAGEEEALVDDPEVSDNYTIAYTPGLSEDSERSDVFDFGRSSTQSDSDIASIGYEPLSHVSVPHSAVSLSAFHILQPIHQFRVSPHRRHLPSPFSQNFGLGLTDPVESFR